MVKTKIPNEAIGESFEIACGDHPEIQAGAYYIFGRDWKNAQEEKYRNWFVCRVDEVIKAIPFSTAPAQDKLVAGNGSLEHRFLGDLSTETRRMILEKLQEIDFPDPSLAEK